MFQNFQQGGNQSNVLNPHDLDKELIKKFALLINTYVQTAQFTVTNPTIYTLVCICQLWNTRRVYTEDKKLILKVQRIEQSRQQVIRIFQRFPSIVLYIDGDKIQNNTFLKADNVYYYEGTQQRMVIFNKQNASRYDGPVKSLTELQPHGQGVKNEFPNSKEQVFYKGHFQNGKKHGYGTQSRKNVEYQGNWQNDEKQGWGRQLIKRKKKYIEKQEREERQRSQQQQKKTQKTEQSIFQQEEEEIKQKEQIQQEKAEKQNKQLSEKKIKQLLKYFKSIYEGPFQKNLRSGESGIQHTKNGKYNGEWLAGLKHGNGIMKYKEGAVYSGQWKNNVIQGKGQYTDQAGNIYEGQFENGIYDGEGTMKYVNGDEYTGKWLNGKKHGKGVYNYSDGDYYDGEWVKDQAQGVGTSMINGIFYEGHFSKGQKHGYGQQTDENGDVINGIWKKNKIFEIISKNGEIMNQKNQQN